MGIRDSQTELTGGVNANNSGKKQLILYEMSKVEEEYHKNVPQAEPTPRVLKSKLPIMGEPESISTESLEFDSTKWWAISRHLLRCPRPSVSWLYMRTRAGRLVFFALITDTHHSS